MLVFILLVISAFLRLIDGLPAGLAPQVAMALLGGALIKDRKWAFILPILSLFISDIAFYFLHAAGLTERLGFYQGQWAIYLLFACITCFGFLMKKVSLGNVLIYSFAASVFFFLGSNFMTWEVGEGLGRPHTFEGLMLCYGDGLAFYRQFGLVKGWDANVVLGDMIWSLGLWGAYSVLVRTLVARPAHTA